MVSALKEAAAHFENAPEVNEAVEDTNSVYALTHTFTYKTMLPSYLVFILIKNYGVLFCSQKYLKPTITVFQPIGGNRNKL